MLEQIRLQLINVFAFGFGYLRRAQTRCREWFSKPQNEYPMDESGALLRHYMAHQSWFDGLSSSWSGRSFFKQIIIVSSVVLFSGLMGILVNAPIVIMLSVAVVSAMMHRLLVAHETNRREGGMIIINQAIKVTSENLNNSMALFNEASTAAHQVKHQLEPQVAEMEQCVVAMKSACATINQENQALMKEAETMNTIADARLVQENSVNSSYQAIVERFKQQADVIHTATTTIEQVGSSALQFSEIVVDFQQHQDHLVQSAKYFNLFMAQSVAATGLEKAAVQNDLIQCLNAELDDNDAFIKAYMGRHQALVVH